MVRLPVRLTQVAAFAGIVLLAACSAPTAPVAPARQKTQLSLDGNVPIPCDSTVVTDGTCRGGWIIPW